MVGWIERAAGPGGLTLALVYLELVLALTLLTTVLHFRSLRKKRDELASVRLYFAAAFVLLLAVPCLITVLTAARPWEALAAFGWSFGRARLGLTITLALLPLAFLAGLAALHDPKMREMYPLAKAACADARTFAGYQVSYFLLYYLPWESVFRGLLFLPLVRTAGLVPALAVQTMVSTLLHIGHPPKEIFAAALSGPGFGLVAYFTGSFFYPLVLHAAAGITTDTLIFIRRRRERP
jgi:membrane protease YdiL (CAAX protease family)